MRENLKLWYQKGKQWLSTHRHQVKKYALFAFTATVMLSLTLKLCTLLLVLTFVMWTTNMLYAIEKPKQRILFLLFHITFFVFLLDRPLIALLQPGSWIKRQITDYGATEDSIFRMVYCMLTSLLGLLAGNVWIERRLQRRSNDVVCKSKRRYMHPEQNWLLAVRMLALGLFIVSVAFKMILEIEKAMFIFQNSYLAYYAEFNSSLPYLVYVVSTFLPYTMCAYLATLPQKRSVYAVLGIFILTAVPTALGGERSKIVINLFIALTYFVFRDYLNPNEKWIGKIEKVMVVCGGTTGVIVLAAMNYVREGSEIQQGILGLIVDFFYKQGVTFSWISLGFRHIDTLRNMGVTNFTFGGIIDYVTHGLLAQKLFHAQAIPNGNNMMQITEGNVMSHHLSYVIMGSEQYLAGHGTGSSYLLEVYADYDMLGVLLFSVALGALLAWSVYTARKNVAVRMCVFCGLGELLMMPRSSAIGFFEFLWRIPFWCTIVYLLVGASLILQLKKRLQA